jgi:hypothetical protein
MLVRCVPRCDTEGLAATAAQARVSERASMAQASLRSVTMGRKYIPDGFI